MATDTASNNIDDYGSGTSTLSLDDDSTQRTTEDSSQNSCKNKNTDESDESPNSGNEQELNIICWNINGMRRHNMKEMIENTFAHLNMKCSILSVQETKLNRCTLERSQALIQDYSSYFSFCGRKSGYSGVATYCHATMTPIKVDVGLLSGFDSLSEEKDAEKEWEFDGYPPFLQNSKTIKSGEDDGRTIITHHLVKIPNGEIKRLVIINAYCPNWRCCTPDDDNTELKQVFHDKLLKRMTDFTSMGFFVMLVGDLNVSHTILDQSEVTDPAIFIKTPFREWMDELLKQDKTLDRKPFFDTFRTLHPNRKDTFSCWNTKINARETNYGTRIDYIIADEELMKYLKHAEVHSSIMGSDHCPISATFKNLEPALNKPVSYVHPAATKFYPEFAGRQQKLTDLILNGNSTNNQKSYDSRLNLKRSSQPKQQSLMTFFVKKPKIETNNKDEKLEVMINEENNSSENSDSSSTSTAPNFYKEVNNAASEAWNKMFLAPETPKCTGHNENCVQRVVKKKGPHRGRSFWACPRGTGRSDDASANCNFFQWLKGK